MDDIEINKGDSGGPIYINSGGDRDALGNFLAWNVDKHEILSVSYRGNWYDIGDLASYKLAQTWLSE